MVRNLNYKRFCEIEEQLFFVCFCLSGNVAMLWILKKIGDLVGAYGIVGFVPKGENEKI